MTYKLTFLESAQKEWYKLDRSIRDDFKKKLAERLESPKVFKDKLHGLKGCYKIKLKSIGYRLVYRVYEGLLVVQVVSVARRDKEEVYRLAKLRLE